MIEVKGNIWDYHAQGHWVVITTNGSVRKDGAAVMGRGVALEAAKRFPELPAMLGKEIIGGGNKVKMWLRYNIFTLPVKHNWWEKADLALIERSVAELASPAGLHTPYGINCPIYLVRPGCGNGGLDWKNVKPILEKYLDDRFIVVNLGSQP